MALYFFIWCTLFCNTWLNSSLLGDKTKTKELFSAKIIFTYTKVTKLLCFSLQIMTIFWQTHRQQRWDQLQISGFQMIGPTRINAEGGRRIRPAPWVWMASSGASTSALTISVWYMLIEKFPTRVVLFFSAHLVIVWVIVPTHAQDLLHVVLPQGVALQARHLCHGKLVNQDSFNRWERGGPEPRQQGELSTASGDCYWLQQSTVQLVLPAAGKPGRPLL